MTHTQVQQFQSRVSDSLAHDSLGVRSVLGFVLSGVAPLLVAAGLITSAFAVTGMTAIPFMLLVTAVMLTIFFAGYLSMAKYVNNAGAFYSYIALGLGRPAGIAGAIVAWFGYNMLQVALYGIFGATIAPMLDSSFLHWHQSWWVWALAIAAVTGFLGTREVRWTGKILGSLIAVEVLVILALSVNGLAHPAPGVHLFAALSPVGLTTSTVAVCGAVAVLGFIGAETAPVYKEEAKSATRTITRATLIAVSLMTLVYVLAPWAMIVHYSQDKVVAQAQLPPDQGGGPGMLFAMSSGALSTAAQWLFLTSTFAAMMAFHNAATRYTYTLGRERVMFGVFDKTNKALAPYVASLLQTVIAVGVIVLYTVRGWDPMVQLFFWLGQTGGFLILVLLAVTSVAVVLFFRKDRPGIFIRDVPVWRRVYAPIVSAMGLGWLAFEVWQNYSALFGEQVPTLASKLLPGFVLLAASIGLLRSAWLYAFRRPVYEAVARDKVWSVPDLVDTRLRGL
jgi:amino acid transporter